MGGGAGSKISWVFSLLNSFFRNFPLLMSRALGRASSGTRSSGGTSLHRCTVHARGGVSLWHFGPFGARCMLGGVRGKGVQISAIQLFALGYPGFPPGFGLILTQFWCF